jgi:hypothetical protein
VLCFVCMSVREIVNLQTDDIRGVSENLFNNLHSRIIMKRSHNMLRVCMSVSRYTHMDHRSTYTPMTFECVPANVCVHVCAVFACKQSTPACARAFVYLWSSVLPFQRRLGINRGEPLPYVVRACVCTCEFARACLKTTLPSYSPN